MQRCRMRQISVPVLARLVWLAGPRQHAQRRAYAAARWIARIDARVRGPRHPGRIAIEAIVMNDLICQFCMFDHTFPLTTQIIGGPLRDAVCDRPRGALIATVHTKLALAAHGAICVDGKRPLFVGFGDGDLRRWSWGAADLVERIAPDAPGLFGRIGEALAAGRIVIAFVDYAHSGKERTVISPNLFAWAQSRGIPIRPMLSTLTRNGTIRIELGTALPGAQHGPTRHADAFVDFVTQRWPRSYTVCRARTARQPGAMIKPRTV